MAIINEESTEFEKALIQGEMLDTAVALMRELGVTQRELAERMGVGEARVSQIFSGGASNVTLETLARIGQALGVRWALIPTPIEERTLTLPTWCLRLAVMAASAIAFRRADL